MPITETFFGKAADCWCFLLLFTENLTGRSKGTVPKKQCKQCSLQQKSKRKDTKVAQ